MAIRVIFQSVDLGVGRTLGMLETRMKGLSGRIGTFGPQAVRSFDRIAKSIQGAGEKMQKFAFQTSFMGFIVQFISFMTIMQMQRIANSIESVIRSVADWRESLGELGTAIVSTVALFGEDNPLTTLFSDSFGDMIQFGTAMEHLMAVFDGLKKVAALNLVKGLFGEDFTGTFEDLFKSLDPEGFKETFQNIGKALRPLLDAFGQLLELLSDPEKNEGFILFVELFANFLSGIIGGLGPINEFFKALKPFMPIFNEIAKAVGSVLPLLVVIGTVLSLTGPLAGAVGTSIKFFGDLGVTIGTLAKKLLGIPAGFDGFQTSLDKFNKVGGVTTGMFGKLKSGFGEMANVFGGGAGRGRQAKAIGGAALLGVGAGLVASDPEGFMKSFTESAGDMNTKLKAVGATAAFAFGTALEIAAFNPALGKFALIGAAIATATAIFIIFRKEIVEGIQYIAKIISENPMVKTFIEGFDKMIKGAEEWAKALWKGSIVPDTMDAINDITKDGLESATDKFQKFTDDVTNMLTGTGFTLENAATTAAGTLAGATGSLGSSIDALTDAVNAPRMAAAAEAAREMAGIIGNEQSIREQLAGEQAKKTGPQWKVGMFGRPIATGAQDPNVIAQLQQQLAQIEGLKSQAQEFLGGNEQFGGLASGLQFELLQQLALSNAGSDVGGVPLVPGKIIEIMREGHRQFSAVREGRTAAEKEFLEQTNYMGGRRPRSGVRPVRGLTPETIATSRNPRLNPNARFARGGILVGENGPELMILPNDSLKRKSLGDGMGNNQPQILQVFLETGGGWEKIVDERIDNKTSESRRLFRGRASVD